jgi:hypothetical protein
MIKWNTDTMRWDYIVNNNSGADNLTIAINSENNYEIKNGGITASKIDTSFLAQIQNLGVDWNQSDPTAGDYVHNKPTNATQTASGFMSS